jgi:MoaA/NifB/PqqE/SkfB family radical SAM enzyme
MFKRVYVEISNVCNLGCSFCPSVKREKKVLSVSDFAKILKQLTPFTEEICLHVVGEPFAHPHFNEIIKTCELHNIKENHPTKIQLSTNGLEINKFSELVLASPSIRQINFSVQCFKDNFPDKDIRTYLLNILNFAVRANELRPEMYINLRLWNIGASLREKVISNVDESLSDLDDNEDIFLFLEDFFKLKINRKVDVGSIKSKRIWNKLSLHFDSRFEWPSMDAPYFGLKGTCHALKGHIGILADGTVVPCCLDKEGEIPLGNCLQQSIASILNSPRAVKMRKGFDRGELVELLCQHCSYIRRFSK